MAGRFWTFEGPDGAGKTTQLALLETRLRARGYDVVRTREPGGDAVGEQVRTLLLDGDCTPEAELLLFAAARAQNVAQVVRPALERGALVLCDRFTDSTIAYQGYGRGLPLDLIRQVNAFATGGLIPEATFLFDLPAATGLARRRGEAGSANRLDREALAFHERVRNGFLAAARSDPTRFLLLDARQSIEEVAGQIEVVAAALLR